VTNESLTDMRPYAYYTVMRQSQDPRFLRLRMALYAKEHGVKPAARAFKVTPKTIRKWLTRFDGKIASLDAQSRAPRKRPRKLGKPAEERILIAKRQAPRFSARRLKLEFELPYSVKAIARVCRDHGLNRPWRRKKPQTKRLLREVKAQWRFCQQIDVDTKNLCDIPEYWQPLKGLHLPQYQYTARDVTTGLLFLGYSNELSLAYATVFAERIIKHLQACDIDLGGATWQSDNGSEFIGSWQAKDDSAFTTAIQRVTGQAHRTIPPGQHRFQADVETVHNLMEQEFYEVERFASRADFLAAANHYQLFFNLARRNSAKEGKTPWELLESKRPDADPLLPLLSVPYLDQLHDAILHSPAAGGYDVWGLPSFKDLPSEPARSHPQIGEPTFTPHLRRGTFCTSFRCRTGTGRCGRPWGRH
jgi:transposase